MNPPPPLTVTPAEPQHSISTKLAVLVFVIGLVFGLALGHGGDWNALTNPCGVMLNK